LEETLDALRRVFLGDDVARTAYIRSSGGYGNIGRRDQFYQNIADLERELAGATYSIKPVQVSTSWRSRRSRPAMA
jgi:hypothetical protein